MKNVWSKRGTVTNTLKLVAFENLKQLKELIKETKAQQVYLSSNAHKKLHSLMCPKVEYAEEIEFYINRIPVSLSKQS